MINLWKLMEVLRLPPVTCAIHLFLLMMLRWKAAMSCYNCSTRTIILIITYILFAFQKAIMSDSIPTCSFCSATVKPNVVFFGEDLPEKYFQHETDFPKADLLIIMGTSLKVGQVHHHQNYHHHKPTGNIWIDYGGYTQSPKVVLLFIVLDWALCQPGEHS